MGGIGDSSVVELAAVLAAFQGGLRIAERIIDGILGYRRNGAGAGSPEAIGREWAGAIKDQTDALRSVAALLQNHLQQQARDGVTQDTILHEIRAHDQATRWHGETYKGGG